MAATSEDSPQDVNLGNRIQAVVCKILQKESSSETKIYGLVKQSLSNYGKRRFEEQEIQSAIICQTVLVLLIALTHKDHQLAQWYLLILLLIEAAGGINNPKRMAKATQELFWMKRQNILSWLSQSMISIRLSCIPPQLKTRLKTEGGDNKLGQSVAAVKTQKRITREDQKDLLMSVGYMMIFFFTSCISIQLLVPLTHSTLKHWVLCVRGLYLPKPT